MTIVKTNGLPAFDRLNANGTPVIDIDRARQQDIRELHVGVLNLMPDAALEATERQFLRLLGESNRIAQIYVHPFTLPMVPRGATAQAHIDAYYESFDDLKESGLDALIVTGANTAIPLSDKAYWQPMVDVLRWAHDNVTSTLCSCFASHVAMAHIYGQPPTRHADKRWGVFRHRLVDKTHPLVRGMNTVFDVPHSRFGDVSRAQYTDAGMRILAESADAGVHLATSPDGIRLVLMQGHPEYDTCSLLREYRREVSAYQSNERADYPPMPTRYLSDAAVDLAQRYAAAVSANDAVGAFPMDEIAAAIDNTWVDSARAVISTWIGLVYQLTHVARNKPFMDGIDPENPLRGL